MCPQRQSCCSVILLMGALVTLLALMHMPSLCPVCFILVLFHCAVKCSCPRRMLHPLPVLPCAALCCAVRRTRPALSACPSGSTSTAPATPTHPRLSRAASTCPWAHRALLLAPRPSSSTLRGAACIPTCRGCHPRAPSGPCLGLGQGRGRARGQYKAQGRGQGKARGQGRGRARGKAWGWGWA